MIKGAKLNPQGTHSYEGKRFNLCESMTIESLAQQLVEIRVYSHQGRHIVFANGCSVNLNIGSTFGMPNIRTYTYQETRIVIDNVAKSKQLW